jgi:hypothetical protein
MPNQFSRSRRALGASVACLLILCVPTLACAVENNHPLDSSAFLRPAPVSGQTFSQVFSRTISTRVEGFESTARRISGTGSYRLSGVSNDQFAFESKFLYDGRPLASGVTKIRRDGSESCWEDKCGPTTDASGLFFNSFLWGTPPKQIGVGTSWHTKLLIPWELGPVGEQEVTVTALDASTGSVTLLRKGSGEGSFDGEGAQIKLTKDGKEYVMDSKPGKAKWSGYTTIARGIIISDELLVERTLSLSSKDLGEKTGFQRQYILLSKTPQSASWEGFGS